MSDHDKQRNRKTPAERAQDAVDVLERRLSRLRGKRREHVEAINAIDADVAEVQAALDYAKQNPALPPQPVEQDDSARAMLDERG